jgi:hypothetical protein
MALGKVEIHRGAVGGVLKYRLPYVGERVVPVGWRLMVVIGLWGSHYQRQRDGAIG